MNQLVPYSEISILPKFEQFSEIDKQVIKALTSEKISKISDKKDIKNSICIFIQAAYEYKGVGKPSLESLKNTTLDVLDLIEKKFKHFTLEDVKLSFKLGSLGDLKEDGDLNLLSLEMLYKFMQRYDKKIRCNVQSDYYKFLEAQKIEEKKELDDKSKIEANKILIKYFEMVCNLDFSFRGTLFIYNLLESNFLKLRDRYKLIDSSVLNNEEMHELKQKAEAQYMMERKKDNHNIHCSEMTYIRSYALLYVYKKWMQHNKKLVIKGTEIELI